MRDVLECQRFGPAWKRPLLAFLRALEAAGDDRMFRPHAFDEATLDRLAEAKGADLAFVLTRGARVVGYGLLRGWDEGYTVPSLGIAIAPDARGRGLGHLLMEFLHAAARERGARQVRLRVDPINDRAIRLYESLGYKFATREGPYLVGVRDL